jgi:hypothetical protein
MLRVDLKYRRLFLNPAQLLLLREALHEIVANALTVEGDQGTLVTPSEVAVYPHELEAAERQPSIVEIYIDADFFESQKDNKKEAEREMKEKVAPFVPEGVPVSVSIRLFENGGFVEFEGTAETVARA